METTMSFYSVDVSRTVKSELTIKYECENCGQVSSYRQTYDTSVHESGQTARKSQAEAQNLSKELSLKALESAQEIAKNWKTEGPESFEYHITYENCPNCGYSQSWMQKYLREKQNSQYITSPIGIVSLVLFIWYFAGLESTLSDLVGNLAWLSGIGIWIVSVGIIFFVGKGIQKLLDPNRQFGKVPTINEPIFIWGEPVITK